MREYTGTENKGRDEKVKERTRYRYEINGGVGRLLHLAAWLVWMHLKIVRQISATGDRTLNFKRSKKHVFWAEVGTDVCAKMCLFMRSGDKHRANLNYHAAWASTSWCYALIAPRMGPFRLGCACPRFVSRAAALHSFLPPQNWQAPSLFPFLPAIRGTKKIK